MTFYYQTRTWNSQPQVSDQTKESYGNTWQNKEELEECTQLPNGFYQTEYQEINCGCDPKRRSQLR